MQTGSFYTIVDDWLEIRGYEALSVEVVEVKRSDKAAGPGLPRFRQRSLRFQMERPFGAPGD